MEYVVLWILALFGLWSLISNILDSISCSNRAGSFDVILNVRNQEDAVAHFIRELSKIDMVGKIRVFDNGSDDSTIDIVKELKKSNSKIVLEDVK